MTKKWVIGMLACLGGAGMLAGQAVRPVADMEPVLARIATFQYEQDRQPLHEFSAFLRSAMASPAALKQIEARLIAFVESNATLPGKDFACRQLSQIGTEASVPVLSRLLSQADTVEMARYALERIPGASVDEALRKAMQQASGKARIGMINSLGIRRDAKSVPALKTLLAPSGDEATIAAASAALAQIGGRTALAALADARLKLPDKVRPAVSRAYLQCAAGLAAAGDKSSALDVYKQLLAPREPEMVQVAALTELAAIGGLDAVRIFVTQLSSERPRVQVAAIEQLSRSPAASATTALVDAFPKLPPAAQVRVLAALAGRGDAAARPLVVKATGAAAEPVRVAALQALAGVGDESCVRLLAGTAGSGDGAVPNAARESLYRMRGAGVDGAIVAAIAAETGKARLELVRAAGERVAAGATPALLSAALDADRDLRREALRALRNVAAPRDVPALLDLVARQQSPGDRREAARTLSLALKRSGEREVAALVSSYQSAGATDTRAVLLEVMGQLGNDQVLPALRSGLKDGSPDIVRAAIVALSEWSTPAPVDDLMAVAKAGSTPAYQVLALRGVIKLAGLPTERPASETARLLGEAMGLAKEPAEKKAVLALLPKIACSESLALARAALADSQVAAEAKLAVEALSREMKVR